MGHPSVYPTGATLYDPRARGAAIPFFRPLNAGDSGRYEWQRGPRMARTARFSE